MTERLDIKALAERLEKQTALLLDVAADWSLPDMAQGAMGRTEHAVRAFDERMMNGTAEARMRGLADSLLQGAGDAVSVQSVVASSEKVGGMSDGMSGGRPITQNIYLKESDPSPYRTAKAIRRESEAMLRL